MLALALLILLSRRDVEVAAAASSSSSDDGRQFVYQGFAGANLTLDGVATVMPSGLLALTNVITYQTKAHAFHPTPLRFLNRSSPSSSSSTVARSFSTSFVFAIVSEYDGLSDHGLAFVVSPTTNLSTASAGQYLGLLNATNGTASHPILAVELDTILNPELRDIDSNHVGIDVNSLISRRAHTAGYYDDGDGGTFRELTLNSREPMQAWVDYDGPSKQLAVTLAPVPAAAKPRTPLLSEAVDLPALMAVAETDAMYVGFSASASSQILLSHHYVLGWSFSLDDAGGAAAPPLDLSKLPALPRLGPKPPSSKVLYIVLPLAAASLLAAAAAASLWAWHRHRRRRFAEVREDWEDELGLGPHRFAYRDLHRATDGFRERNLLGVGGFGRVYKGVLSVSVSGGGLETTTMEIAVKRVSHESRQGVREFVAEVVSIGRLRHRNLVQLLGYCRRREDELLLVYDYMPNGSLDKHLHTPPSAAAILCWPERYRIIRGVASGLLYLHEDWEKVVIHRDIKASNVLLDEQMNGRLGDFGLARLYDHGGTAQTTRVVGTMGYLAPELLRTGKATTLTDVFAFGVFLLEVACGRRPIELDRRGGGHVVVLVDWVLERHRGGGGGGGGGGSVLEAADPRLAGKFDAEEMGLVLKLGLLCSHPLPSARPSMRKVVQYLERGPSSSAAPPELSPTYMSYSMLALMMQGQGFDSYVMSSDTGQMTASVTSVGALSFGSSATVLAEGR